jgi:peptidoglycan/xylan/chitin deacetylase (PgdA/CDA1 family)
MVRRAAIASPLIALSVLQAGAAFAAQSAVVLLYHRFGESAHPSTSVTIEQFEAHLQELRDGKYVVRPLTEIAAAMRAGRALPDNTLGISIDDAFSSVYHEAWPRLRRANIPFTLFVATDAVDRGTTGYMSWSQIRELAENGVTIGSQTASHPHMPLLTPERNAAELEKSSARFRAELGIAPTLIAYPYGEYSLAVGAVAKAAGFAAGFGQHSGVIHPGSNLFNLPRFAFNESYGDLDRFRLAGRALPLQASDVTPADPFLAGTTNPPLFGFTVQDLAPERLSRLACYVSGQGKARIERLGERRIEVRMAEAFRPGRTRVNCTLPASGGRWRWFGRQFVVPPR